MMLLPHARTWLRQVLLLLLLTPFLLTVDLGRLALEILAGAVEAIRHGMRIRRYVAAVDRAFGFPD